MSMTEVLIEGPFVGMTDPFAEEDYYFNQIHGNMIGIMMAALSVPLLERGYLISREASLQITEGRKPDLAISVQPNQPKVTSQALAFADAHFGVMIADEEDTLSALTIRRLDQTLVTVIELVSPGNKTSPLKIAAYRDARTRLFMEKMVNIVEIDLTRSTRRLYEHSLTLSCAYHVVTLVAHHGQFILPMEALQPLHRCEIPLNNESLPLDLQAHYERAYRDGTLAVQLQTRHGYAMNALPYQHLLTDEAVTFIQTRLAHWHRALNQAGGNTVI